jgi:hypothetical protein
MIIEDLESHIIYECDDIEYLIDDDVAIGEVYLDGKLVFQTDDIYDNISLRTEFDKKFTIIEGEENEDLFAENYDY